MPKVSVIIPVYNGEDYLRQCLDSVCGQTLKEIEIICVDDGSTDSSFQILEEYRQNDARIQLFQQQNRYAGTARNLGKAHAAGEYLIFWDCDDFFEPEALEQLYTKAADMQADICVCGGKKYFHDTQQTTPSLSTYLNLNYVPGDVFNRASNPDGILNFTTAVPWNKLFRRQFIEENHLDFQEIRNGNDIYFTQCALALAERITTVNEGLIYYRVNNKGSLTGTLSKSPMAPLYAWIGVEETLCRRNAFPEKSFVNKAIGAITALLRNIDEPESFLETVRFLQDGGLEKLHIKERDESFYYVKWHHAFVTHFINDTPEQFQAYLAHQTYAQLLERTAEKSIRDAKIKQQRSEIRDLSAEKKKAEKAAEKSLKELEKNGKELEKTARKLEKTNRDLEKANQKLDRANKNLEQLRNSWAYKIGRILVWLPGKIKGFFAPKKLS